MTVGDGPLTVTKIYNLCNFINTSSMIKLPKDRHVIPKFKVIQLNNYLRLWRTKISCLHLGIWPSPQGPAKGYFWLEDLQRQKVYFSWKHKTYSEYQLLKSEVPYNFLTACIR